MAPPTVESFTMDQLTSLSRADLDALVREGMPVDILFGDDRLRVRFTVIDRAVRIEVLEVVARNDGALTSFASGCRSLARRSRVQTIEWLVHAAACAAPNERLQGVLTGRGFVLQNVAGIGQAYRRIEPIF